MSFGRGVFVCLCVSDHVFLHVCPSRVLCLSMCSVLEPVGWGWGWVGSVFLDMWVGVGRGSTLQHWIEVVLASYHEMNPGKP